jgi:hypothetical protein
LRLCFEAAGEPLGERREEALLRPVHDLARQKLLGKLLEEILAGAAALLEGGVQPRAELEEAMVEIRHARL